MPNGAKSILNSGSADNRVLRAFHHFKKNKASLLIYALWVSGIVLMSIVARESQIALLALVFSLVAFAAHLKNCLSTHSLLEDMVEFYEHAHSLDDLQILNNEKPYQQILDIVIELGRFDWAVIFSMDYEKDRFVAVEARGIQLNRFSAVNFDDIVCDHDGDGMSLALKLLEHAFKNQEFRGALAGTALGRNNTCYGSLLVGRYDADSELTDHDSFRLDILSDQISICLHNYRLHKELAMRAEEMSERQAQLQRELEMAKIVQDGVMPRQIPVISNLEYATFLKPARMVGGDFIMLQAGENSEQMGVLIGDVCGKGVPASLIMAVVVCLFKEKGDFRKDPAALMGEVNVALKSFLGAGSRFNSTAFWGVFDFGLMQFRYASAGHDFPLLYSSSRAEVVELPSTGTLLGIFAESEYKTGTIDCKHGDKLIFYSDGLIDFFEADDSIPDGFLYLQEFVSRRAEKTPDEMVKEITTMVENSPASVKDDITVAVFAIEKSL